MLKKLTTPLATFADTINDRLGGLLAIDTDVSLDRLLWQTGKSREELLDIILADDEIDACRQDIESSLKAKPYRIWGDELSEDDVNRLLVAIRPHMPTLIAAAVLARFSGFAIIEYVYKQDDKGFWVIDKMLPKDNETHNFTLTRHGKLFFHGQGNPMPIDTQIKCLALTSRATPARPMGEMMIVKAYPAVMLRNKGFAYAGQFITRYAQPFIIGKQGQLGASHFVKAIFNLAGGGAAAIGFDDSIEISQLSSNGDAFTTIERLANARIQKLTLGRVKISELSNGSRAALDTDDKARMDRMSGYAELLGQAVQHAIDAIVMVNREYGTPIHAPNGVIFEFADPAVIDLDRTTRDKTYAEMGLTFTSDYYKDMLGLEEHHFSLSNTPISKAPASNTPASTTPNSNTPMDNSNNSHALLSHTDAHLNHAQSLLSHRPNDGDFVLSDGTSTQTQSPIKDALTAVLTLSDSEDYHDFQAKLSALSAFDLPSDELITDLAQKGADEWLKGFDSDLAHDHDHHDHNAHDKDSKDEWSDNSKGNDQGESNGN